MNAGCEIRLALASDIETVVALERTIENAPHWTVADYVAAMSPARPLPGPPATRRCLFVAEAGPHIVGFAVGRVTALEAEVLAELESVAVANSVRRSGIGRALCDAVIAWAREQGAAEIELEVRTSSNGAIALYTQLGFATVGARAKYYRGPVEDAVLMRLDLAHHDRDL